MRDSCIFYRSFYEAIKELPSENQAVIYDAIFAYSLDFIEPNLEGLNKSMFTLIKPQIDANIKRYNNGLTPKNKQTISKTEANNKQNGSKVLANVNDNVNANVNDNKNIVSGAKAPTHTTLLLDRKLLFKKELGKNKGAYNVNELKKFYEYWTEENKSKTKMRFELEKTWNIKLRLNRWFGKDENFNSKSNMDIDIPPVIK